MFKTQVEPRAEGEWFHCIVFMPSFLWSVSVDHGKLCTICFLHVFLVSCKVSWKSCVTCYVNFMIYTLIDHNSRPISARGFTHLL